MSWQGNPPHKRSTGSNGCPINRSNISVSLDCRPVLGEHSLTVGVDFNLPRDFKTGSFKAKVKPSYSGKIDLSLASKSEALFAEIAGAVHRPHPSVNPNSPKSAASARPSSFFFDHMPAL
jgi:hypothetical protein